MTGTDQFSHGAYEPVQLPFMWPSELSGTMRAYRRRSNVMESPCKRSWGAMLRNLLPHMMTVLGQRLPIVLVGIFEII